MLAHYLNFKLLDSKNSVLYFFEYFTVHGQMQNTLLTGWFDERSRAIAITCTLLLYSWWLYHALFLCSEISTGIIGKKDKFASFLFEVLVPSSSYILTWICPKWWYVVIQTSKFPNIPCISCQSTVKHSLIPWLKT